MTPERLAEIEAVAKKTTRLEDLRGQSPAVVELVAALREAQAKNEAWAKDFKKLAHECGGTELERQALATTVERVRALAEKWDKDWETSGSVPAAGAIRNCTFELHRALIGEDVLGRSDTEQQQQQINASEGEEH